MKFKVGDRVKIQKKGNLDFWNSLMIEYAHNTIGIIVAIKHHNSPYKISTGKSLLQEHTHEEDGKNGWWYRESNLVIESSIPEDLFIL